MAKKHEGRVTTITTKSIFGSHKEMIVGKTEDFLILEDDRGKYLTTKDQLDTGLVDHNRATRESNYNE